MNKKIKKILPYVCALLNIGSAVTLNNQTTFAAEADNKKKKLKDAVEFVETKWLSKFFKGEGEGEEKKLSSNPSLPYECFNKWSEPAKPQSGQEKSAERIAWEAVKKFAIEPHYGIISGTLGVTDVSNKEELEKCVKAIIVEIRTQIYNGHPLSNAASDIIGDVLPAVLKYSAFGAAGWKLGSLAEKLVDSYVDRRFENYFASKEQKAENKRSLGSVENLGWDFNSIDCKKLRNELIDVLIPMYPYAENEIKDYITTLIGIIKQKQKNPNAPTVIVNVHGDPGCGKSTLIKMTMNILAKYNAINNEAKPLFITPTDSKTTDKEVSAEDLCFGSYSRTVNGKRIKRDSTFAACLKYTDNFITILDDIDKQTPGVFKILWNIADGGLIDGYPTSKVMFMSTANSDLTLQSSAVSGSQSSEAILSRVKNIHFPNPDSTAYQKSFISEVEKINENDDEPCKISVSNSVLKSIGDHCVKARKGMREKNALIIKLRGLLVNADANGWTKAEIKFNDGELLLVEKKLNSKNKESENSKAIEKSNEIKNIANIASIDAKLNQKLKTNVDEQARN